MNRRQKSDRKNPNRGERNKLSKKKGNRSQETEMKWNWNWSWNWLMSKNCSWLRR